MSESRTIDGYLADLNAVLEVGLRSRRRILTEVADHLCQATQEQLRRGTDQREAQRRAIAAFGSPQEVAARFEAGLIGTLDRRLALSVRWTHHWLTQHRAGPPVFTVIVSVLFAAAFAVVGTAFDRDALRAATVSLAAGTVFAALFVSRSHARRLRDITASDTATVLVPLLFLYPAVVSCLVLLDGEHSFTVQWLGSFTLVWALWCVSQPVIERAIRCAARRCTGPTDEDRRRAWSVAHPWWSAVAGVAPLPLGLVVLMAVHPSPVALRVALVALMAAMTALAAVAVRLEAGRRERDAYQRALMSESMSRTGFHGGRVTWLTGR